MYVQFRWNHERRVSVYACIVYLIQYNVYTYITCIRFRTYRTWAISTTVYVDSRLIFEIHRCLTHLLHRRICEFHLQPIIAAFRRRPRYEHP
jgi:hypothetical protein